MGADRRALARFRQGRRIVRKDHGQTTWEQGRKPISVIGQISERSDAEYHGCRIWRQPGAAIDIRADSGHKEETLPGATTGNPPVSPCPGGTGISAGATDGSAPKAFPGGNPQRLPY